MRAAPIGAGQIAHQHLACPGSSPGITLAGACDPSRALAESAAEQYGAAAWFTDHRAMLGEARPDVVHITTPPGSHFRLAMERDYIHTTDPADAHQFAVEATEPGKGRAYDVGTETVATVLEVTRTCEEAVGRPIPHGFAGRRHGDPAVLVGPAERLRREQGRSTRIPDIRDIIRTAWDRHRRHPEGFPCGEGLWRPPLVVRGDHRTP